MWRMPGPRREGAPTQRERVRLRWSRDAATAAQEPGITERVLTGELSHNTGPGEQEADLIRTGQDAGKQNSRTKERRGGLIAGGPQ